MTSNLWVHVSQDFTILTWFDKSFDHVLHVHFMKFKKAHECQSVYLRSYEFIK